MVWAHIKKFMTWIDQSIGRTGLVAVIDLGTTKACCLIAKPDDQGGFEIVGIGHQKSHGIASGSIIEMDQAEATIRAAVEGAELMADENIRNVIVNVSCGHPQSRLMVCDLSSPGHKARDHNLQGLIDSTRLTPDWKNETVLIHVIPVGYKIDGRNVPADPTGLRGQRLEANMHIVNAATSPVRNLEKAISRCHLDMGDMVVSPYASGLGCLSAEEKKLGVTCIDMGGGTTSISVFFNNQLVHIDSIPFGGIHVTNDIARGLWTPLVQAERIKTLYGNASPRSSDDHLIIKAPLLGEERTGEINQVTASALVGIIGPRIEKIFEMVRDRLDETSLEKVAARRIVLTGGGSQLPGLREVAESILDKHVRYGKPAPDQPKSITGPEFSTAVGLLEFAFTKPTDFA